MNASILSKPEWEGDKIKFEKKIMLELFSAYKAGCNTHFIPFILILQYCNLQVCTCSSLTTFLWPLHYNGADENYYTNFKPSFRYWLITRSC